MLVLTRKSKETIQIGNATVTILRIQGGNAKIGIEAPKEVAITRGGKKKC